MKPFFRLSALLLLLIPTTLSHAQTNVNRLTEVTRSIEEQQWEKATGLFREAIRKDSERAEMFYWIEVDKSLPVSSGLAHELASFYKTSRNYDKAYLFYKELLQSDPKNIQFLTAIAEVEILQGKEQEALHTYEKVLEYDPHNLEANIYAGNYHYLKAELEKQKLENDYGSIKSPTRMQQAKYKNELDKLFTKNYSKARTYLQNVIRQFSSVEAKKTLGRIREIEEYIYSK